MYNQLAVVLFACAAAVHCNDLQLGTNYGRKIFDEKIEASPAIWKQVQKITINTTRNEVITAVVVTDHRPEKDGVAKVVEGGEGQRNVTVELQSPTVFRGFDFHVVVYGIQEDVANEYPGVMSNDTKVNAAAKPESTESVDVTAEDVKPTVPSNADEKAVEKEGPSAPAVTRDQARNNRDTKDQETVDPIVQYVNPELTTEDQEVTDSQKETTEGALKATTTDGSEEQSSQANEKKTETDTDYDMVVPAVPIEVSQGVDVKIQRHQPIEFLDADFTTDSDPENTHEKKFQQNFDSISKELGQKVVFGFRNQ